MAALANNLRRACGLLIALALLTFGLAASAIAQRVQIPVGGPPSTYAPTPGWPSAPITPIPGPTASLGAPTFDPYSNSVPFGAPPANVPYSYAPPATSFPTSGAPAWGAPAVSGAPTGSGSGWFSESWPLGWEQGSYGMEGGGSASASGGTTSRYRRFIEELRAEHTWLIGDHSEDALEIHRTEISTTCTYPVFGNIDTPLLLTPGFAFNWLEGPIGDPAGVPRGPDLPPRMYDAYLDAAWYPQFNPLLGAELGVRTGVWTDFNEVNTDSVRILGRGAGVVTMNPNMQLVVGATYIDRVRIKLLPVAGIRWRPAPDWDLYLVFPNPKVRRRFSAVGATTWYWFVAGEYGGGSWTVDRAGTGDRIDYNDLRVTGGFEWETPSATRGQLEVGFVFDREVIFGDTLDPRNFEPNNTLLVRVGVDF